MLKKWKKAVIHLECATNSIPVFDINEKRCELNNKLENNEISQEDYNEKLSELFKLNIRHHGTALFLVHNSKRYLITARHVVFDEKSAEREKETKSEHEMNQQKNLQLAKEHHQDKIFNNIFHVPSLDEIHSNIHVDIDTLKIFPHNIPLSLINLGTGHPDRAPYTFSSPPLDLAIISLDQRNSMFADQLSELGYEPISSDYIIDGPTQEGTDVFTIGFPSSVSTFGRLVDLTEFDHLLSPYFSLPCFSFGKVSMLHEHLAFFWADLNISPGNSGGPVIENDKLVGIIHGQAKEPVNMPYNLNVSTGIPFAKIIKTEHIWELLRTQEEKDSF